MATKKITDLTKLTDLDATDSFVVNDSSAGADKRVEFSDLQTEILNGAVIGGSTAITQLTVDNLRLDGNTISSQDTNGNILLQPNGTGDVVINDAGADSDFRVEGDTDANLLFVDASTDRVGIGTSSPTSLLDVRGAAVFNEDGIDADFRVEGDTDANLLFVDASADKVGIGTGSPVANLTVGNLPVSESGSTSYGSGLIRGIDYTLSNTQRGILDVEMSALGAQNKGATLTFTNNVSHFGQGLSYVGAAFKAGKESAVNTIQSTYLAIHTNNGGTLAERLRIDSNGGLIGKAAAGGHTIFNEDGIDADFRVEGDTDTHLIFADAGNDRVGIGTSAPSSKLDVTGDIEIDVDNGLADYRRLILGGHRSSYSTDTPCIFTTSGGGSGMYAQYGSLVIAGRNNGSNGDIFFATSNDTTDQLPRMVVTKGGNVKIGGTADRATTEGSAQLVLFNGTAPVGTLANGVSFYSASGEANVMDAAGNATLLSPHDKDTNEWIFRSKHTPTGKVLKIDVERMLRFINDHFGLDMIEEFTEA